jgi:hypothetical protein
VEGVWSEQSPVPLHTLETQIEKRLVVHHPGCRFHVVTVSKDTSTVGGCNRHPVLNIKYSLLLIVQPFSIRVSTSLFWGCRTKKEIDAMQVDERILESQITVRGSYRKPKVSELAIVQFWLLPYHLYQGLRWQWQWFVKYNLQKEPYEQDAKEYLTRTFFHVSNDTWDGLDDKRKTKFMQEEVWIPENEEKIRQAMKLRARQAQTMDDFEPID